MDRPFPNTIVCQIGARRHYAVPVALHQAGLLERLYTDFCMSDPLLRGLRRVTPSAIANGRLAKLFGREVPEIPADKITCLWKSTLRNSWSSVSSRRQTTDAYARYCRQNEIFGHAVVRRGFGTADAVYGFNGAAVEIFTAGRTEGRLRILDQTIAPLRSMSALLEEERRRWPDWDLESADRSESVSRMIDREQTEFELSDIIICGSEFVADSLVDEGVPADRLRIVRWGNQLPAENVRRDPPVNRALRVLIAGTVELRKGIPYAVEAAKLLSKDQFEFRCVGPVRLTPRAVSIVSEHIALIGAVPRSEMPDQYRWADVLLHPSLAEGSANVCYEAQAWGLPVITTPNAGSAVVHGESGFIVPIRDARALADRLMELREDICVWRTLSAGALTQSLELSAANYRRDLTAAIGRDQAATQAPARDHLLPHSATCR